MKLSVFALLALPALSLLLPAQGKAPKLVKDIYPGAHGPHSSFPNTFGYWGSESKFTVAGGVFFFSAFDGLHGRELWSSLVYPGTARLVADIQPGDASSGPESMIAFKNRVFFAASTPARGKEAWVSDGTTPGTYLFQESIPGADGGGFYEPFAAGGALYFFAKTKAGAREYTLFKYDGSSRAPAPLKSGFSAPWKNPTAGKGFLLFEGATAASGNEPWVTDGTPAGTRILRDWNGPASGGCVAPVEAGGEVYFASMEIQVRALWKTDGKTMVRVGPLPGPGRAATWRDPVLLGNKIIYGGYATILNYGTALLPHALDLSTGKSARLADPVSSGYMASGYLRPVRWKGKVFFCFYDNSKRAYVLWATDGTKAGTGKVTEKGIDPANGWRTPVAAGGKGIFFAGWDSKGGWELWRTDGTAAGTARVKDIDPGPKDGAPMSLTPLGTTLVFTAQDPVHGRELWKSDGTAKGTVLLQDIYPGAQGISSGPQGFSRVLGKVLFSARDPIHGIEPWVTDGTPGGTFLLKDMTPGSGGNFDSPFLRGNGWALFSFPANASTFTLWRTDGTPGGTAALKLSGAAPAVSARGVSFRGKVYFEGKTSWNGREPWVSDGTAGGTRILADLAPGSASGRFLEPVATDKAIFFLGKGKIHYTLWKTDGTAKGTVQVLPNLVDCGSLIRLGDKVLFEGMLLNDPAGLEPWISDGTAAGTHRILDLAPGTNPGRFLSPFRLGGKICFFGTDGRSLGPKEFGLFLTDGTAAGTVRVGRQAFGNGYATFLGAVGQARKKAVFWGYTPEYGWEPWVTDGTGFGTHLLRDLSPGPESSWLSGWTRAGMRTLCVAWRTQTRYSDLLVTDGTSRGTRLLSEIYPGRRIACSGGLALCRGKVLFSGDDGSTGLELWSWFPGATAQEVGWSSGVPTLHAGADPVLGTKMNLQVDGIPPKGAALLFLGKPLDRALQLPGGGGFLLDPKALLAGIALGPSGKYALSIPADPTLAGSLFAVQALVGPAPKTPLGFDFTGGLFLSLGM